MNARKQKMKQELQEKLFDKYPKIFRDKDKDITQSCMGWGIECPDAWYDLIDACCDVLQWFCDNIIKAQIYADQVKEKFGRFTFYFHFEDDITDHQYQIINGILTAYEQISTTICYECGSNKNVKSTGGGWIAYFCEDCMEKNT